MESSSHPPRPLCRDDFEIAIICALPLEYNAVSNLFDGYWDDDGDQYGKVDGDQNTSTTGWIGKHNVVLAILSERGKASATSVATSFSLSYTRVQLALLVGICGGVPKTGDGTEILLGDVVISQRLVQYDFGRRYSDGFRPKHAEDYTQQISSGIDRFLTTIKTDRYREHLPKLASQYLTSSQERHPKKYDYPGASEDKLFRSTYRHKHQSSSGCDICNRCTQRSHPTCDAALTSTCEDLKCEEHQLEYRKRLDRENTGNHSSQDILPHLFVHFGVMASGDSVMKSAFDRDEIAQSHNVIAFEMEAAGVFRSLPCPIVKGTVLKCADRRLRQAPGESPQDVVKLQQTIRNLEKTVKELQAQKYQLPLQVPCRNLVAVNDALGETYSFSLNFIDSLELFVMILRRKFEHVGLGKIERGEWMLQNSYTGHVLNLTRWKAAVKPGQTLDMSMIFRKRKRHSLSILCPWCNTKNEIFSDEQHVECQKCSGRYRCIEEVNEIGLQEQDSQVATSPLKKKKRAFHVIYPRPPQRAPQEDDDDNIHMYTRVQMVDVDFRVVHQNLDGKGSAPLVRINAQHLEDLGHLAEHLAKSFGLSEEYFLGALRDRHDELWALGVAAEKLHSMNTAAPELPGSLNNNEGSTLNEALAYLDDVKSHYPTNPEFYNRFLDIMKDSKALGLDTQDVWDQVTDLFHGAPDLLKGFNRFLPPGYRTEEETIT